MKKLIPATLILVSMIGMIWLAQATPTIIVGSPQTVSSATYTSAPVAAFQYNPTLQQYSITHGSLGATTDIQIKIYGGVNGTNNAVQVGLWYPSQTNAATEVIYAGALSVTNQTFVSITTTNSQQVYIGYGQ